MKTRGTLATLLIALSTFLFANASTIVIVPIGTSSPPKVSLRGLNDGQVLIVPSQLPIVIPLEVDAFDPDGSVVKVEYFDGLTSIGTVYASPPHFTQFWHPTPGEHVLTAKATDNTFNPGVSDPITVKVISPFTGTVEATDPDASEDGDEGVFTIRRSGDNSQDVAVSYLIEGSAINGTDYETITNVVTIPAGFDAVELVIHPIDDVIPDGREIVKLTMLPLSSFIPRSEAVVYIADNDGGPTNHVPQVTLSSPLDGQVLNASFLTLQSDAKDWDGEIVSVEYFEGANSLGIVSNSGSFQFNSSPSAASSIVQLPYPPISPIPFPWPYFHSQLTWNAPAGEYVLTAKATDNDGATTFSDPAHITVLPLPIVTVSAADAYASEPGTTMTPINRGVFTIRRTGDFGADLTVFYSLVGSAELGSDFTCAPGIATIPANQSSVDVVVTPLRDRLSEGTETVTLKLTAPLWPYPYPLGPLAFNQAPGYDAAYVIIPPSYDIGSSSEATVYIQDNTSGTRNRPPEVKILTPQSGQTLAFGSGIWIAGDAADRETCVVKVELFDGTTKVGEIRNTTAPTPGSHFAFEFGWANPPVGLRNLRARATDTQGAVQLSTAVRIRVK